MEFSRRNAKIAGWALFAAVFFIPLGWIFCSIWWWEAPGTPGRGPGRGGSRTGKPALRTGGRPLVWCRKAAGNELQVHFSNGTGGKLKIIVPGSVGGVLRIASSGTELRSPARVAYDGEVDAIAELLPGATYTMRATGDFPAGPLTGVYDTRAAGLPEGVWSGRTTFSTQ